MEFQRYHLKFHAKYHTHSLKDMIFIQTGVDILEMINLPVLPMNTMKSSNGKFSALLAVCAGNSSVTGEFTAQRPVTWRVDIFFDLHLSKRLSKQSGVWWFDTPSQQLWRHYNVSMFISLRIWLRSWFRFTTTVPILLTLGTQWRIRHIL